MLTTEEHEKLASLLAADSILLMQYVKFSHMLLVTDETRALWEPDFKRGILTPYTLIYNFLADWKGKRNLTRKDLLKELEDKLEKHKFKLLAGKVAKLSIEFEKLPTEVANASNPTGGSGSGTDCPDHVNCPCIDPEVSDDSGKDRLQFKGVTGPLVVKVAPRLSPIQSANVYPAPLDAQGAMIIMNVTRFANAAYKRKGADQDTENLQNLFENLSYDVKVATKDQLKTKTNFKACLQNFKDKLKAPIHSCIVFIGSHGNEGKIQLENGEPVDIFEEIVCNFKQNCPQLKGKPTIFLIQACRGRKQYHKPDDDDRIPGDTMVCYGTLPEYVAKRHPKFGSLFIHTFAKTVMENAHQQHFKEMIEKVNTSMEYIQDGKPGTQLGDIVLDTFAENKFLYFNPV